MKTRTSILLSFALAVVVCAAVTHPFAATAAPPVTSDHPDPSVAAPAVSEPTVDPYVAASAIGSDARDHCILCRRAKCDQGPGNNTCPCNQGAGTCSEAGCAGGSVCGYCHGGFGCLSNI
ncbi:MAG TPA: hypothetical protein VFG76_09615 [Candidatus Polarisedimenticolia bacterium]|nr:hypothetical protein [Candidatus Polarisedimenticolia bacterium]